MMHAHNRNLYGYLTFAVLLAFSHQTTTKNECQKDSIKTGQELLDTAPTLFNEIKSESFDGEMAIKWLQKYAFGVLCHIKPNFEMNENFKLQNNFCQQLKNGKSMEEAAVNVESAAIKVMLNLDKPNILQNIRQKIVEDSFLDEKNKEKMAKLLGQFQIGMDKFYAIIKDRLNVTHSRDEAGHSNGGGNALRQHQRRRRKRMRILETVTGRLSSAFSTENAGQTQPASLYGVQVCVGMFVTIACTIGAAIFLATTEISHPALKIAMFAFLVVAFLIESPLFIWQCVVNKL